MHGDFSRITYDPFKHFTRVLMQQGRVQLDADWNEQVSMLHHYLRALAADLIGEHGGPDRRPKDGSGNPTNSEPMDFEIKPLGTGRFNIGSGHYYVQGILVENETTVPYDEQPDYPDPAGLETGAVYLAYLDVWERFVSPYEDIPSPFHAGNPTIREVALNGADTCSRARLVWQVKTERMRQEGGGSLPTTLQGWRNRLDKNWPAFVNMLQPSRRGALQAKAAIRADSDVEACLTPPDARYRGTENQLYRVEIHRSGPVWDGNRQGNSVDTAATFKWSRENGSVTFPVRSLVGVTAELETLGRDASLGLTRNDWVEVVDDPMKLAGQPGPLAQVEGINPDDLQITLTPPDGIDLPDYLEGQYGEWHVYLRRWDHKKIEPAGSGGALPTPAPDGALFVEEDRWLTLEKGVQVKFTKAPAGEIHQYQAGDYWTIPARVATGDVEWPHDAALEPRALAPFGVTHAFAPLAVVTLDAVGAVSIFDMRRLFAQLAK